MTGCAPASLYVILLVLLLLHHRSVDVLGDEEYASIRKCSSYDDVLSMQAAVSTPVWEVKRRRAKFSFPNNTDLLFHDHIVEMFAGRKVLMLGNSNMRILLSTILQVGHASKADFHSSLNLYTSNTVSVANWPWWPYYPTHGAMFVHTTFNSKPVSALQCPFSHKHAEILPHESSLSLHDTRSPPNQTKSKPGEMLCLFCDICNVTRSCEDDESALFAFQFTGTPGHFVQRQMVNAIIADKNNEYKFLHNDVTDVVMQIQTEADLARVLEDVLVLHQHASSREEKHRVLHFYLMDRCLLGHELDSMKKSNMLANTTANATATATANAIAWDDWYLTATRRISQFSRENGIVVAFLPFSRGEVNGGNPVLVHERAKGWHWSFAGKFYHGQAFLNVFRCVRDWQRSVFVTQR